LRSLALAALCACGRIDFAQVSSGDGGANGDGPPFVDDSGASALVAWFPFEGTYADVVSHHDGTCTTCPTFVAGHKGQAVHFDGTAQCITAIDVGHLDLPQVTVALWANADTFKASASQVSKRATVNLGIPVKSWKLGLAGSGNGEDFETDHGSSFNHVLPSPANVVQVGSWQHFAASFDGTTNRLYVDGALVASDTLAGAISYTSMSPMLIGCEDNGALADYFPGAVDELQVYNRALTDAEVALLAAQ
jgi:hypothetical protein